MRKRQWLELLIILAVVAVLAWFTTPEREPIATPTPAVLASSTPLASEAPNWTATPWPENVPFPESGPEVLMETDHGNVKIRLFPKHAPLHCRKFTELVKRRFYDKTPIYRVVPGFVVQFGINGRQEYRAFKDSTFKDEPNPLPMTRGTISFAKAGPDTQSTQVFINLGNNQQLTSPATGGFSVFGLVIQGMDQLDKLPAPGDPSMGLDQGRLWSEGDAYLKSQPDRYATIQRIRNLGGR